MIDTIKGNRKNLIPNKLYKSAKGNFYFYVDEVGREHIVRCCWIAGGKEDTKYRIVDCLLINNVLKQYKVEGCFDTKEECMSMMKSRM